MTFTVVIGFGEMFVAKGASFGRVVVIVWVWMGRVEEILVVT